MRKITLMSKTELIIDEGKLMETQVRNSNELFKNGVLTIGRNELRILDEDGNDIMNSDEYDEMNQRIKSVLTEGKA